MYDLGCGGDSNHVAVFNGTDQYCSAEFGTEEKRLTPTKRPGRDGKQPTTNHRAEHDWREKEAGR